LTMNCEEVRRSIQASGRAEWPSAVSAHLATCDACVQHVLTEALIAPPAVTVPPNFSNRVVVRLPENDPRRRGPRWPVIAAATLSALILPAGLWLLLPEAGTPQHEIWGVWYWAVFLAAAGESAVLIAWAYEPSSQMDGSS